MSFLFLLLFLNFKWLKTLSNYNNFQYFIKFYIFWIYINFSIGHPDTIIYDYDQVNGNNFQSAQYNNLKTY